MQGKLSRLIDNLKSKASTSGLEAVDDAIVFRHLRVYDRLVMEGVFPPPPNLLSLGRPSISTLVFLAQEGDGEPMRAPFDVVPAASWCARCISLGRFASPCPHIIYACGCYLLTRLAEPWWGRDTAMFLRLETCAFPLAMRAIAAARERAAQNHAAMRTHAPAEMNVTVDGADEIAQLVGLLMIGVRRLALSIGGEQLEGALTSHMRNSLSAALECGRVYDAGAAVSLVKSLRASVASADLVLGTNLLPPRVAAQAGCLGAAPRPAQSAAEYASSSQLRLVTLPSPIGMGLGGSLRSGYHDVAVDGDAGGAVEGEEVSARLERMSIDGTDGERDEGGSLPSSPPRARPRYAAVVGGGTGAVHDNSEAAVPTPASSDPLDNACTAAAAL